MVIYVARHGQTEMNRRDVVSGVTDVELTPTGVEQAELLAARLKEVREPIGRIIASPLRRAQHTAQIVSAAVGVPVETDERLREQDYGIYEGKSRFADGFLENKRQFTVCYPDGESMFFVCQRVYNFLDEAIQTYAPENILLVAHGGVVRVIRTYFRDMTNDEYFGYNAENASFEVYRVEDARRHGRL